MGHEGRQRRTEELRRRNRRYAAAGLVLSLLVHLAVFIVFRGDRLPPSPFAAAGPRAGSDRAAAGGGMQAVALRTPPAEEPEEILRPPEPIPVPEAAVEELETLEAEPRIERVELRAPSRRPGTEEGEARGPGLEAGDGEGDGGTAEAGRFRVVPPTPRGIIMPPSDRPDDLDGREIEVWVFVTARGEVVADSTRIHPPTGHDGFDERLREQAAQWVFEPARRGGKAVAEWFRYIITL